MAKLPLIEIRPNNAAMPDLYDRQFIDAVLTAEFMIGKHWGNWVLYIRGRKYDWPKEHGLLKRRLLVDHIEHCLELDEAFYG